MKRKQIYLTEDVDEDLKRLAKFQGRTESDLIREALRRYLKHETSSADLWEPLIGMAKGGRPDESRRVDEVVYVRDSQNCR